MNVRSVIFFICLIAFVGSSSMIVNSLFPDNQTAVIATAVLTASLSLYAALIIETMTTNIVNAIVNKNLEDQTSLLSAVIGKTLYKVIKEENATDKTVSEKS